MGIHKIPLCIGIVYFTVLFVSYFYYAQTFETPVFSTPDDNFSSVSKWLKLPTTIDFSAYKLNTSTIQGDSLYIHDAQWIDTVSSVLLIVLNRNKPGARPPDRGGSLFVNISRFLPSVNVTIVRADNGKVESFVDVECRDIDNGDINEVRLMALLVCRLSSQIAFKVMYLEFRGNLSVMIPSETGSASRYFGDRVSRRNPPPRLSPKSTVGACIGGVNYNALPYLREFVQYHLLIGVSHLYLSLGANFLFDDNTLALEEMLADFIEDGLVSVIPGPIAFPDTDPAFVDAYSKVPFYHSCVWHSKAYDNYTIVTDIDEYVILYERNATIGDAIASIVGRRNVTCGILMEDYVSTRRDNRSNSRWMGETYYGRGSRMHGSRKSIVLTQKANYPWLHRPYNCDPQHSLGPRGGLYRSSNESFYLLHYAYLFGERGPDYSLGDTPYIERNEYTSLWFNDVHHSLAHRCKNTTSITISQYCKERWRGLMPLT